MADDYESRIARIQTTIRACLDSREEDEDFFSASDGGGEDSPPRSPRHDDEAALELDGNHLSAGEGSTAACTYTGIVPGNVTAEGDGRGEAGARRPLPACHESGPASQVEHNIRLVSTSNSTLIAGPPHNGNNVHPDKAGGACRQETTAEPEPNSCVAGRSDASNTVGDSAAPQTLATPEHCAVASFAGISVSDLRPLVKVSHHSTSPKE